MKRISQLLTLILAIGLASPVSADYDTEKDINFKTSFKNRTQF